MRARPLQHRILSAFVWTAAFSFACGLFLALTLLFKFLPPTKPVAVGLVTIAKYSKLRDYFGAALFFLLVPPLTLWLRARFAEITKTMRLPGALLFTTPFFLSPFFYLTTGKVGWIIFLPLALAYTLPRALNFFATHCWIRDLFRRDLGGYHALLFTEALSWILFRYFVTGRRIAHVSTLFLEVIFVAGFLALFWGVTILIARIAELNFGAPAERVFRKIVTAALPLIALPFLAVAIVPLPMPRVVMIVTLLVCAAVALRTREGLAPRRAWRLAAYAIIPALIYLVSYASTAQLSQWIDLFHRGESLGPASDYLRGKTPFRDVMALHGMLEDGQLDAWLMELFGRSVDVAISRQVILGAFLGVSIWFLGLAVFDSIPLAMLCVAMGAWTTAENNRTFFQVAAVALFWIALRRRSRVAAIFSGVFAGVALFFSYEIGIYTIAGGVAAGVLLYVAQRFSDEDLVPLRTTAFFLLGVILGAAPFLIYLASRGAVGDFFVTSFITIPRIIDAVWSLPFPDLVSTFRRDLNLHTLAEFVLFEKFHLVLTPLTIAVAAIYCLQRVIRRRADTFDHALLVLTIFATVTQRTAFGRAEFRHQYFAAFLVGPMLVVLGILVTRALRRVWRDGDAGTRAFVTALVAAAVPLLAILFWIPDLVNARIDDLVRYTARVLHVYREGPAEEVGYRIQGVSDEIGKLTKKNEPIFDFSNQPAFYFFANRPNPTRFYQVPILSPANFQAETIRVLEKTKPKVVIRKSPERFDEFDGVPNELRAQALAAYLDDTYRFHRSILGVELWRRVPNAKPQPLAKYLAKIRMPSEKELATSAQQRMVFPAVGSVWGASGTHWVSDLTLHNPFREPISISLRYIAGDFRLDRRFTLAPRQTLRWADAAKEAFGVEDVVGTLWLTHREGRAPVAVVKTSDVAHNGRASVEEPLTMRDAAAANSDNSELTIVGVPAETTAGRRVNVGIVNVGIIPATFRISIGKQSIESGVPENEVWMVPNIEGALGVKIDYATPVRITTIAGTGVAFASVVEPSGDNEFIAAIPAQQQ